MFVGTILIPLVVDNMYRHFHGNWCTYTQRNIQAYNILEAFMVRLFLLIQIQTMLPVHPEVRPEEEESEGPQTGEEA